MIKKIRFVLVALCILTAVRSVAQGSNIPNDPTIFHFFTSQSFLSGPDTAGTLIYDGCGASYGRIRAIKFGDYIYTAWLDYFGGISVACVGSTHLKELVQTGAGTSYNNVARYWINSNLFFSNSSPCLAVFHDTLNVLFIDKNAGGQLQSILIGTPGDLPKAPLVRVMPGNVTDIQDLSATTNNFPLHEELVITGRSPSTSKIRAVIFGDGFGCMPTLINGVEKMADQTSAETANGYVGICRMDSLAFSGYFLAWAGTDATQHINTTTMDVCGDIKSTPGGYLGKYTYTDRSSCGGGVELFLREGAPTTNRVYQEIHMLWRGTCGDTKVYQGVFAPDPSTPVGRASFPQSVIGGDIASSNVAPTLVSLNSAVTYMMWPIAAYNQQSFNNYVFAIAKGFDYNNPTWMGNLLKDEQTLKNAILPGSHNAGMNDVVQVANHGDFYKAGGLPDFGHCNECGFLTQSLSIGEQMRRGYRYFSVEVTNSLYTDADVGATPYTSDGDSLHSGVPSVDNFSSICIGEGLETSLDSIRNFLSAHNSEIVILNFNGLFNGGLATTTIEERLNIILPKYKSIIYQQQPYEHTLADIFEKPIGSLRGKLIITMTDSVTAGHLALLRDVFDVSPMNQYRYHDKSTNSAQGLADDLQGFVTTNPGGYKRLDWYTDLALQRVACSLKPDLGACAAGGNVQPGFWHHVSHIFRCGAEVFDMAQTVADALEDPFALATVLGWEMSQFTGSAMQKVDSNNKLLYPTVYDMTKSGRLNKSNMVNIIYTDAADQLYTDLCMQTMLDLNDPLEMSAFNGAIKVEAEVISTTCSDTASGAATVQVSGGNPPYKYYWELTGDTTAHVSHLTEGHHKVRIKDALGHVVTKKVYVPLYENTHSGIATRDTFKTEVQPVGLSNYYEAGCDGLVARIESNYSTSAVYDIVTARVWIDSTSNGMQVRRHYQILPALDWANTSGRITLYYTQADFDNYNAADPAYRLPAYGGDIAGISSLFVQHRGGPGKDVSGKFASYPSAVKEIFPHAGDVVWNDVTQRWEVSFNTQSFGGFFISTCDAALQNTWLDANAYMQDKMPLITWQVQEKNIARYEVEYSYDGRNFMTAGVLDSKGHGRNDYQLAHNLQLPVGRISQQVIFYRVRQTDNEGVSQLSRILPVYIGGTAVLAVYPNPFGGTLNITSNTEMPAMLCDITGKIELRLQLRKGNIVVEQETLMPGLYFLKTQDGQCYKVVKCR